MNKDYIWRALELADDVDFAFYGGTGGIDAAFKLDWGAAFPDDNRWDGVTFGLKSFWGIDRIVANLPVFVTSDCMSQAQPTEGVQLGMKIPMINDWGEVDVTWKWSEYAQNYNAAHIPFLPTDACTDFGLSLVQHNADGIPIPFDPNALRQIADNAESIGVYDDLGECTVTKKVKGSAFDPSQLADVADALSSRLELPAESVVDMAADGEYDIECKWGSCDSVNQALCDWIKKLY